jgi:uncharacterized protein YjbJ (UPF0337 family)
MTSVTNEERNMDTDRIKGAGRDIYGRGEEAVGSLTGDNQTRGRGMMDQAAGQAQNAYGKAKDTARDMTDQAMEAGEHYYDQSTRAIRDTVQSQPIGSLLIAAAAGFALAWMMQGRDDR